MKNRILKTTETRRRLPMLAMMILVCGLMAPLALEAQETADVVSGGATTNQYVPMYNYYNDYGHRSEYIIPASYFSEAGINDGDQLTSITIYRSATGSWTASNLTIILTNTSTSYYSNSSFLGKEGTTVFSSSSYSGGSYSSYTFTFDDSFEYTGGSLVVHIWAGNGGTCASSSSSSTWLGYSSTTNYQSLYSSGSSSANATTGTRLYFLPNTTFEYIPAQQGGDVCDKPETCEVSNVTGTSATITWSGGSGKYNLELKGGNYADWTTVLPNTTLTTTTLTLQPTTSYQARVQSVCDGDTPTSGWKNSASFTTPCDKYNIPYTYDFETEAPFACWTSIAGVTRASGTSYANNSTYYLRFAGTTSNLVALPQFNVPTNTLRVEFYTRPEGYTYSSCGTFSVGYMTDITDASTFVAVETYAYNDWTSNNHVKKTVDFIDAPATANIAFRHNSGSTSYYWFADDVTVKEIPSCVAPTALNATSITSSSAQLGWTANNGETAWTLYYKKTSDASYTEVLNATNPQPLNGLTASTNYEYYVVAKCSASDQSEPSEVYNFATECASITSFPWGEKFNSLTSGIPICWDNSEGTTTTASYKWNYYASGYEGACLRFNSYNNSNSYTNFLKTPVLDLSGLTNTTLSFWFKNPTGGDFSVYISTDGGATYAESIVEGLTGYSDWTAIEDWDISDYDGESNVVIVFKGTSNYGSGDAYIYLDEVVVREAPSCMKPTNLTVSDITANSAKLAWDDNGATQWQYMTVVHGAGEPDWTSSNVLTSNTHANVPANIQFGTGQPAQSSTEYDFWVRANCTASGNGYSEAVMISFTTACETISAIGYSENFDSYSAATGFLPMCWSRINTGTNTTYNQYPYVYNYGANSASNCLRFYTSGTSGTSDQYAILPPMEDLAGMQITLQAKAYNSGNSFKIGLMTDPNDVSTFVEIGSETLTTSYQEFAYTIPANTTANYVAIMIEAPTSSTTFGVYIDDINMESCPKPTNLVVSDITSSSAKLAWTTNGSETSWVLQYGTDNTFATGSYTEVTTGFNTQDAPTITYDATTGITAETVHYARVQAVCGGVDNESGWSNIVSFEPTNKQLVTGETTGTNGELPTNYFYYNSLSQQIYTPTDLGAAGMIESIDFNISASINEARTFDIYMVNTNKATFEDGDDWITVTAADKVCSKTSITLTQGWNEFILDEPFLYDGTQNVAIIVDATSSDYESGLSFLVYQATGQAIYVRSDATNYDPTNPTSYTGTVLNVKNQIRILKSPLSGCIKPTNLTATNVFSHTVDLTWTENGEATAWQICLNGDETNLINVTTNPYTLTGLDPETTYNIKVRANCGGEDGVSSWSNTITITTDVACQAPTNLVVSNITGNTADLTWSENGVDNFNIQYREVDTLFFEGFEEGLPSTWTTIDADGDGFNWDEHINTGSGNFSTHSGDGIAISASYDDDEGAALLPDNWLITPQLDLQGTMKVWLTGQDVSDYYEHFAIYLSTTGTEVADFTIELVPESVTTDEYVEFTADLDDYIGQQGYIAIRHFNCTNQYWLNVDDFGIYSNVWQNATASSGSFTLTGLTPKTEYEVRVQGNCGADGTSAWTDIVSFTTDTDCPAPSNLVADNVTSNSAEISWNESADSYNLRYTKFYYGFETAEPWVEDNFSPCTTYDGDGLTTYQITDWTPLGDYQFVGSMMTFQNGVTEFGISHGGELFGGFVDAIPDNDNGNNDFFITPSITIESGDVFEFWAMSLLPDWGLERMKVGVYGGNGTISHYFEGSATEYVEVPNEWTKYSYDLSGYAGQSIQLAINCVSNDAYILAIDDVIIGYEVVNNITSNQYALTGLEPNTEYGVQVQADCGGEDGTSQWSDMVAFTTLGECDVPSNLSANAATTTATLDWDGVQESYNVRYRNYIYGEATTTTEDFSGSYTLASHNADGVLPTGWVGVKTGSYKPHITTNSTLGTTYDIVGIGGGQGGTDQFMYMGDASIAILPQYSNITAISFQYAYESISNGTLTVGYCTENTDGESFIALTNNGTSFTPANTTIQTVNMTAEAIAIINENNGYLAFKWSGTSSYGVGIDNVSITNTTITYGVWNTSNTNVESPLEISGLTPETTYEWQVQGVNSSCTGGVTDWSESNTFTTKNLILDCETEDFSGVTPDDDYEATNLPDGWVSFYDNEETSSYGGSYHGYHSHVATNNNYFGNGNNYLLMISNRTDATGSYPAVEYATYAITPYKDVYSFQFKYRYENTSQGTFEFGYVTDNTGYGTWVALDTPTKTTDVTTYTASAADLATIRANNGYVALKYGGVTSSYYFLGVDDIEVCTVEPKLWPDFVTEAPDSWTWDGESSTINITCAEDLAWLISVVNGYNGCTANDLQGKTVNLTAPIMSMLDHVWVPIGYSTSTPFKGTFDGNGMPIAGVHIDYNSNETDYVVAKHGDMMYAGLFGYTENATIKNLSLIYGQEGEYHGDTWMSSEQDGGYLGALVGYGKNLDVEFCHVLHVLGVHANLNSVGAIVGYAETTSGNHAIKASSANGHFALSENLTITNLGGLAGYSNDSITNCFAMPVSVDLKYDDTFTPTGTVITNNGAVVGYGTKVSNVYVHPLALTEVAKVNGNDQSNRFYALVGGGFTDVTSTFSEAVPRTYGNYSTNNTVNGTPLADILNKRVSDGYKWITPPSTDINMGYPLIVRTDADAPNAVLSSMDTSDDQLTGVNVFVDVNVLIPFVDDETAVYMFGNGNIETNIPSSVNFYIDENAAVTQSDGTTVNATVGVTLKNTEEGNAEAGRDWHLFSPTIEAGKTGVIYGTQDTDEPDESLEFGSDYYLTQGDPAVYFPDGITVSIDEPGKQFDLYSFYEPEYHWINLKRTKDNHWHQDVVEGDGNIAYDGTDNENGAAFTRGKGYLVALGNNSTKNNNLMQAKGVLNSGHVTVSVTAEGEHLTGYNLIGNPYQSYLDFNKFANANKNLWEDSESIGYKSYLIYNADKGGFVEYLVDNEGVGFSQGAAQDGDRYINMHQGFFVVKNGTATEAVFEDTMRVTNQTPHFRDELPAYPLVNLFCTDSDGKQEVSVIEFERPEAAGSLKMKGMLNAKGNMYVHWGSDDFGSVFIDHMPDFVPVWFDAAEDGVFTMTWNTANANFGYMHLIDNMTGVDFDCLAPGNDSYTFHASVNDMSARFRLVFKPLGIEEETTEQDENFAFINGNELVVNGEGELSFIDLNGRVLVTQYVNGQQTHLAMPKVAVGMYMLRLTNGNETKVQKIVIRK